MFCGDCMGNKIAVSNTGPIIHLKEIDLLTVLNIFDKIIIPTEVKNELMEHKIREIENFEVVNIKQQFNDLSSIIVNKFSLDLGEAEAIALAVQEKAIYFLTDDLDARNVAKSYGIESHGTVGIISRAYREKIVDKKTAIDKVKELYKKSSLFITKNIIDYIINEIERFEK